MNLTDIESQWIRENIQKIEFLNTLNPEEMENFISDLTPRVLAGTQPVIREGEPGKSFFLIFHGRINVWVERDGKKAKLATLQGGDYFGEISLLTGQAATANVMAMAPSKVFLLNSEKFIKMVKSNKDLAMHIMAVMKQRLEDRKDQVLTLMNRKNLEEINQEIAEFLKG